MMQRSTARSVKLLPNAVDRLVCTFMPKRELFLCKISRGMELHHKLRRDPSWHPSSCNICGQLGHQAANCTTGTINWRQIYGEDAFRIKPPIYWSDIVKKQESKQVDYEDLRQRAKRYARVQCERQGIDYDAMINGAQSFVPPEAPLQQSMEQNQNQVGETGATPSANAENIADVVDAPSGVEVKADPDGPPPLPEGWATAKDSQGRIYYWHKKTQEVQWEKPKD